MKILILTTSHPYKVAGIVAIDLYKFLKLYGHEVQIITKAFDRYDDINIIPINSTFYEYFLKLYRLPHRIFKALLRVIFNCVPQEKTNSDYAMLSINQATDHYKTKKIMERMTFTPDAIIVLFMPDFLSFKNLYELNKNSRAPILLYMMDMAPFTGGCHYAWDCKGYMKSCGNCPALYSVSENDQTRRNWSFKNKYIEMTEITAIAGTEYQYRQLQKSSLFKYKMKMKILLGIDSEIFKPLDKVNSREYFKIPLNKKVLFFGATSLRERRKGFDELLAALQKIKADNPKANIHLAIAGIMDEKSISELPFNYTFLGLLNHKILSKAFNSSDVFVCPSIEDSGPMMINQSIMCGTPVVTFEMGVALDLVITGKTGYRAKLRDSEDLAKGIKYILELNETEYNEMSENCRNLGLELLHPQKQVKKFIEIIKSSKMES